MSYDRETKARALAAVQQGANRNDIAVNLNINRRTVDRWAATYLSENVNETWADENVAVINRATELTMDYMDAVEESGDILKHGITLNAIRGTAIDKAQRVTTPQANPAIMVFVGVDARSVNVSQDSDTDTDTD